MKDFGTELVPDRLIAVATGRKAKVTLEQLIASDERLDGYRDKIEVMLAGGYLKV